jgi:hypothetical protein
LFCCTPDILTDFNGLFFDGFHLAFSFSIEVLSTESGDVWIVEVYEPESFQALLPVSSVMPVDVELWVQERLAAVPFLTFSIIHKTVYTDGYLPAHHGQLCQVQHWSRGSKLSCR